MKEKYNCYPVYSKVLVLLLLGFPAWAFFYFTRDENFDGSSVFITTVFILMFILSLFVFFRKVEIDGDKITVDIIAFFKKKSILISEIKDFRVKSERDTNVLILSGEEKEVKAIFCQEKFVSRMREILRRQCGNTILQNVENIKKNGFYIGSIFRSNLFNADGITDLKTKQFFPWNEISCNVKESKHRKKYLFFAEKKIPVQITYSHFCFAIEGFFDEMSEKCKRY